MRMLAAFLALAVIVFGVWWTVQPARIADGQIWAIGPGVDFSSALPLWIVAGGFVGLVLTGIHRPASQR